jgi:hypothetical protein
MKTSSPGLSILAAVTLMAESAQALQPIEAFFRSRPIARDHGSHGAFVRGLGDDPVHDAAMGAIPRRGR